MKRSTFFLITAILAFIFAAMMLLVPGTAAEGFGMAPTPETNLLFRSLGGMLLSASILNFLVRNHRDSDTLKAVLMFNVALNLLGMLSDVPGIIEGILPFGKVVPGHIVHLFIIIGSFIYLRKIKSST